MNKRDGDRIKISGDYQYRALHSGHAVQRFWHTAKQLMISRFLPPDPSDYILDVGCGSGVICDYLGVSGARVTGIDGNSEAVEFASRTFSRENVHFKKGQVDEAFSPSEPVSKIYCLEVIEHVYVGQGLDMLKTFHRILRPGGAVLLTTPNYHSLWPAIETLMDLTALAPRLAEHQHVERYHAASLAELCKRAGFVVEHIGTGWWMAPWIAPVSWKAAEKLARAEFNFKGNVGSILICMGRKV